MIAYDPDVARWVYVYTDSLGNYDLMTSKSVATGKAVWHSLGFVPTSENPATTDIRTTKVSAEKTTLAYSFTAKGGKTVTVNTTCTKQM